MTDSTIRKAFVMLLNPGCQLAYQKRHDEIWPGLIEVLKDHGASNYSIFLDTPSNQLFAYVEVQSEEQWNRIAQTEVCQRWWAYMKDIMASNPDNSPVSRELSSMFFMA
ncbi:L-rhamnose mutarotase [Alginatibacterium sediminis]|uniref:L-rhamnose mutarotase n=1 Tax=Alginatibacterium sediminis TaxID=2164068 RepID=A0A420EB55_9ALTE|nr:L-rhamnose mutarotase [Alginatibacterium sediminis]RKF17872.1 L-rhamnose mutarotase [Alginatibacterium sediminis]